MIYRKKHTGFTLIELSIVIVIIGLIVAGVVGGQSLVKQAQLRNVISEHKMYDVALNTFFSQYNAIPGDMGNAYDFWGSGCAGSAGACNGNGDKVISDTSLNQEVTMFWRHLSIADIIPGEYVGVDVYDHVLNKHVPASSFPGGGWYFNQYAWWSGEFGYDSAIGTKHRFNIGAKRTSFYYHAPLFLPKESRTIDVKIDDGLPYSGKVISHGGFQGGSGKNENCTEGSGASATYELSHNSASCNMMLDSSLLSY